jgi:hypothetical protein
MKHAHLIGSAMICAAVIGVGFALYQQNERHYLKSQRWFEVCKKQTAATLQTRYEQVQKNPNLPEEAKKDAKVGIEDYDQDYLYSKCFKEWHAGN